MSPSLQIKKASDLDDVPMPPSPFMFATGIECSYPTIKNGKHRVDELALTKHYERWREDLHLTHELGIKLLRYGIPYHLINTASGRYDWSFTDEVLPALRELEIEPILDLCHFGMPDWLGNSFQNPDFPKAFAAYARAFAKRYPWVRLYTPVNEIFVCAKFSAREGLWNEQAKSDRAFVVATKHLVKASLLAMREIMEVQPHAIFIQSESSEYTHSVCHCQHTKERVSWENQVRFLALDLLYCHEVRADIHTWLLDNGMTKREYTWFMDHGLHSRCVMGNDYYAPNERILQHDGTVEHTGEVFGWYVVTRKYYERYHKPMMHTETNNRGAENAGRGGDPERAVAWLWKQWQNLQEMRSEGVPILGFTWYSLIDQVDWDTNLSEANGRVNPLGLYDLDRKIRPVGRAYKELIREFGVMPAVPDGEFISVLQTC